MKGVRVMWIGPGGLGDGSSL